MKLSKYYLLFVLTGMIPFRAPQKKQTDLAEDQAEMEQYRPVFHFTPEKNWTNDPNGLVYLDGEYHLF